MTPNRLPLFACLLVSALFAFDPPALRAQGTPAWWAQTITLSGTPTATISLGGLYNAAVRATQVLDNDLNAVGGSGLSNQALTALLQNPGDPILMYGQYFGSPDLSGPVAFSRQETVAFDWSVTPPDPSLASDDFSVRWTSTLVAPQDGSYPIGFLAQGAARLWVNGVLVLDHWDDPIYSDQTVLTLTAGTRIAVELDYAPTGAPPSVYLGTKLQLGLWGEGGGPPRLDLRTDFNQSPGGDEPTPSRWTGEIFVPGDGTDYNYNVFTYTNGDAGLGLWLDDMLVYSGYAPDANEGLGWSGSLAGGPHSFRLEASS